MEIPKRINSLLKRRTRLAKELGSVSYDIDKWLLANHIEPDDACWMTGVEIYVNPDSAEKEVRKAICKKEEDCNASL